MLGTPKDEVQEVLLNLLIPIHLLCHCCELPPIWYDDQTTSSMLSYLTATSYGISLILVFLLI